MTREVAAYAARSHCSRATARPSAECRVHAHPSKFEPLSQSKTRSVSPSHSLAISVLSTNAQVSPATHKQDDPSFFTHFGTLSELSKLSVNTIDKQSFSVKKNIHQQMQATSLPLPVTQLYARGHIGTVSACVCFTTVYIAC